MYVEHNKPNWDKLWAISVLTSDSPYLGPALKKNPYICDFVPKIRLKLDVFFIDNVIFVKKDFLKAKDNDFWRFVLLEIFTEKVIKGCTLYIIIIIEECTFIKGSSMPRVLTSYMYISLNIFCMYIEDSPTKTIYIKGALYGNTHTHTMTVAETGYWY